MTFKSITNVLFDTSFLLKDSQDINDVIKILRRDGISCYISPTVRAELDNLYYYGQVSRQRYNRAIARCKKANVRILESTRGYFQDSITKECTMSMNQEHGVEPKTVRGDCSILTSGLNNHIDLILSEDFHFTSKLTDEVINTVCERTCDKFRRLCECDILALDKETFLAAYKKKKVDMAIVDSMKHSGQRY